MNGARAIQKSLKKEANRRHAAAAVAGKGRMPLP
jgi:hypothetical protein